MYTDIGKTGTAKHFIEIIAIKLKKSPYVQMILLASLNSRIPLGEDTSN